MAGGGADLIRDASPPRRHAREGWHPRQVLRDCRRCLKLTCVDLRLRGDDVAIGIEKMRLASTRTIRALGSRLRGMTLAGRDALPTGVMPAKAGTHARCFVTADGASSGLAWIFASAGMTFAGRDALPTGVIPADAGTQSPDHGLGRLTHRTRFAAGCNSARVQRGTVHHLQPRPERYRRTAVRAPRCRTRRRHHAARVHPDDSCRGFPPPRE